MVTTAPPRIGRHAPRQRRRWPITTRALPSFTMLVVHVRAAVARGLAMQETDAVPVATPWVGRLHLPPTPPYGPYG